MVLAIDFALELLEEGVGRVRLVESEIFLGQQRHFFLLDFLHRRKGNDFLESNFFLSNLIRGLLEGRIGQLGLLAFLFLQI